MKNTKKAVTLVEAIITLSILAIGLTGVYRVYNNSIRFLDGVAAKTQAIQIAREGIEAVENIRDTNWQMFPSNTECCWNVADYNVSCINEEMDSTAKVCKSSSGNTTTKMEGNNYVLVKDINPLNGNSATNKTGKWFLVKKTGGNYDEKSYKEDFLISNSDEGYFQTFGDGDLLNAGFKGKTFTRRIEIEKVNNITYLDGATEKSDGIGIKVTSIVEWRDMSSSGVRRIKLENLMTNHKK